MVPDRQREALELEIKNSPGLKSLKEKHKSTGKLEAF